MDEKSMKFDKYDIKKLTEKKTEAPGTATIGITWVDGRIMFKHSGNLSKFNYAICHYSLGIWSVTPLDFIKPTMLVSLMVSPTDNYCEKAYSCLDTGCDLNRFNPGVFESEWKEIDPEFVKSVCAALPANTLWMNKGKDREKWQHFALRPQGGTLKYDEKKGEELGVGD
jgi:hypothetical protein